MKNFVLIVEDEEHIRIVFHDALHEIGIKVVGVATGEDGVETYRLHRNDVSLVVLDLSLPGMSGEETLKELKAINPNVKVVVSSGFPHEDVSKKFVNSGVAGYLQKPYNLGTLTESMGRFLRTDGA